MASDRTGSMDSGELAETFAAVKDQVVGAVTEMSERLELERRLRENPWPVLGVAAAAGFVLGGGLWPALRPFVKAMGRAALSPSNLVALAAALGAARAAGGDSDSGGEGGGRGEQGGASTPE
jgi:hypothetical protein